MFDAEGVVSEWSFTMRGGQLMAQTQGKRALRISGLVSSVCAPTSYFSWGSVTPNRKCGCGAVVMNSEADCSGEKMIVAPDLDRMSFSRSGWTLQQIEFMCDLISSQATSPCLLDEVRSKSPSCPRDGNFFSDGGAIGWITTVFCSTFL